MIYERTEVILYYYCPMSVLMSREPGPAVLAIGICVRPQRARCTAVLSLPQLHPLKKSGALLHFTARGPAAMGSRLVDTFIAAILQTLSTGTGTGMDVTRASDVV